MLSMLISIAFCQPPSAEPDAQPAKRAVEEAIATKFRALYNKQMGQKLKSARSEYVKSPSGRMKLKLTAIEAEATRFTTFANMMKQIAVEAKLARYSNRRPGSTSYTKTKILQVIDHNSALINIGTYKVQGKVLMSQKQVYYQMNTKGLVDGSELPSRFYVNAGTKQYTIALGAIKTVAFVKEANDKDLRTGHALFQSWLEAENLKNDPSESLARKMLDDAIRLNKLGKQLSAQKKLELMIRKYPQTKAVERARTLLSTWDSPPE